MSEDQKQPEKPKSIQVKTTDPFHLKDKAGKGGIVFDFKKLFGFIPEQIILQKVHGMNNRFVMSAVLTEEELKRESETVAQAKKGK